MVLEIKQVVNFDSNQNTRTEAFVNYYDIFVRHAFGNYRDVLKEVSYNPLMATMLTYLRSKSTGYSWRQNVGVLEHPDEVRLGFVFLLHFCFLTASNFFLGKKGFVVQSGTCWHTSAFNPKLNAFVFSFLRTMLERLCNCLRLGCTN